MVGKREDALEPVWLGGYYAGFNITVKTDDKRRSRLKKAAHSLEHRPGVVDVGFNENGGFVVWIVTLEKATLTGQTPREARRLIDNLLAALPKGLQLSYRSGTEEVDLRTWRHLVTGHRTG